MSSSGFISQFAVYQTCRDLDAQVKLYTEYGFVVDDGYDPVGSVPDEYYAARGITKLDLVKTKALKLPADPYMHLVLSQFNTANTGPQWPAPYDQLGSRGHAFLVKSVDAELARIAKDFPNIKVLHTPLSVNRKWGKTTSALMLDPEGVFFEIIEIDQGTPYFSRDLKVPHPEEKSWLHFMYNSEDPEEVVAFYQGFDLAHDNRVDFRDGIGFHPYDLEKFAKEHKDAMSLIMDTTVGCEFLRNINDLTNMHLEICLYKKGSLKTPDDVPVWPQRGISRYCFRTATKEEDLERSISCGHKILIPDNKICVRWGDSEYYYFADTDGNLLTSEQWHHWGYFGAKN